MAYQMFDFNAKYRFGIDEMDRDHKQLVDMLNHVSHVLDQGKIKEAAEHFNQMLSVYVAEHFANEEKFMEGIEYPYLERHRAEHARFREAYHALRPKIAAYDEDAFRKGLLDTFFWLVWHIGKMDKDYAEYYRKYNLRRLMQRSPELMIR